MTKPWWVSQFEDATQYAEAYKWQEKLTNDQAAFVARKMKKKAFLLDLGCGYGRHVKALADRGFSVLGVDRSKSMLELARKNNSHPNVHYLNFDLRELGNRHQLHDRWSSCFDGAYSMFSSFGYFSDRNNRLVLRGVYDVLKGNGVLVLDLLSPVTVKDKTYRNRVVVGSGRFKGSVYVYSHEKMKEMLNDLGFRNVKFYGWYDDSPYDPASSRRLLVVARKRKSK